MEKVLNDKTIAEIKANLLAEKKQILHELSELSRQDSHEADNMTTKFPEYGDKPDENAQEINDYSTSIVTEKVLEKSLEDIEKALKNIEKGTYGICKYCGKPIDEKRLFARPTSGACVSCKKTLTQET